MRWAAAAILLLLLPQLPLASAAADPIQPGDEVNGICTLNFVFDGVGARFGKVYIGTAAHCVSGVGETMSSGANVGFGTVVYTGDVPSSVNGGAERENGIPGTQLDFALIEVKPAFVSLVRAEVLGRASMPTGFTRSADTARGDALYASGYGTGVSALRATRENRTGLLWDDTPREWVAVAAIVFGDSGGPILHQSGKALGIVSGTQAGVLVPPVQMHGPTVEGVLAELADLGYPAQLRTA